MQKVFEYVRRIANSTATVFISGESGTGKEVIAKAIHQFSDRRKNPFVAINCSAIPDNLLETELFGHARGAFTGAVDKKVGLFETAEGGTLLLDEIADLSLPLQGKILRVLQDRKIKRVGENNYRDIDVRIITATHKCLAVEVQENRFREDLFFRLNVIPLHIPPLRERMEDVVPLAEFFLEKLARLNHGMLKRLSPKAIQFLNKEYWRGNVRELENYLERSMVLSTQEEIQAEDFQLLDSNQLQQDSPRAMKNSQDCFSTHELIDLESLNDAYIQYVLKKKQGSKDEAAKLLGIDRKTLYRKLSKHLVSQNAPQQQSTYMHNANDF
jgi:two-component system response regulator HydG